MKKIVVWPNKLLRVKAEEVSRWGEEEKRIRKRLEEVLKRREEGLAIAAEQVGAKKRIFVVNLKIFSPSCSCRGKFCSCKDSWQVVVNPEIKESFGEKVYPATERETGEKEPFLEGCLSFPHLYGSVKRWLKIKARWQEPAGDGLREREEVLSGLRAIVFQHELDHLNGVLFVDHIQKEGGELYLIKGEKRIRVDPEVVLQGKAVWE